MRYSDPEVQESIVDSNLTLMNSDQRSIFDTIMSCQETKPLDSHGVFFIYGPGGTGKTFLYNTILAKTRSQGRIGLAVASSGIAATLLSGGRTAHSRFKIPITIDKDSSSSLSLQFDHAKLIREAALIVWDEAPMMHRHVFESVDRACRDIMGAVNPILDHVLFGGKIFVFGGDFRQVLPVVKRGGRGDIVSASLSRSTIWQHIKVMQLTINMRVARLIYEGRDANEQESFAKYLLELGEGRLPPLYPG